MKDTGEYGWLVEKGDVCCPRYLMVDMLGICGWAWTAEGDHDSALRFASREDAEKVVSGFGIEDCERICDHYWG